MRSQNGIEENNTLLLEKRCEKFINKYKNKEWSKNCKPVLV